MNISILIIGTFPPNPDCAERSAQIPFFYGNVGSLWSIIEDTNLFPKYSFDTVENIKKWLDDYSVGVTDVLKTCSRSNDKLCSTEDKDLIITTDDLDQRLKSYILNNLTGIERIYFTSGGTNKSSNSAFYWFTKLMGKQFAEREKHKLIKLPSPSGSSYTSNYRGKKERFGLVEEFYQFLEENYPDAISFAEDTWKQKMNLPKGKKIRRLPEDRAYSKEFKTWFYTKYLQLNKLEK
jgi:hypothetical protein